MKRVLGAALLFAVVSFDVPVRAVYEQAWTGAVGDPSSGVTTEALTTTNGNTICVGVFVNTFQKMADGDVTDSKSNTYTRLSTQTPGASDAGLFYATNIAGGASHTITFTRADGSYAEVVAVELSGMEASAFDVSAIASDTGTTFDTTAATTTATDTLCGVFGIDSDATDWDAGTGFTQRSTGPGRLMLETQDSVTSGSRNATASRDMSTSTGYVAILAAFKEAGGGGSPTCRGALLLLGVGGC